MASSNPFNPLGPRPRDVLGRMRPGAAPGTVQRGASVPWTLPADSFQGRVVALPGEAQVRGADGAMRPLKVGDLVHPGETVLGPPRIQVRLEEWSQVLARLAPAGSAPPADSPAGPPGKPAPSEARTPAPPDAGPVAIIEGFDARPVTEGGDILDLRGLAGPAWQAAGGEPDAQARSLAASAQFDTTLAPGSTLVRLGGSAQTRLLLAGVDLRAALGLAADCGDGDVLAALLDRGKLLVGR